MKDGKIYIYGMTKQEFLKKARIIHGYKYIYPLLTDKVVSTDDIDILYKDVLYQQKVSKHLMGRCPERSIKRKTTKEYISECREVWGNKYDYSLTEYKGALKKVKIIYDGVIFEQRANSHLKQAPEMKWNLEWFLKLSKDKWGDKYDYSEVVWKNSNKEVRIIHIQTGKVYFQSPKNHIRYAPENRIIKGSTDDFVRRSQDIHNGRYNYSKVNYTLSKDKVTIICPRHGEFEQVANTHLQGYGCEKCGYEDSNRKYQVKYSTEEFIKESRSVWGDKYDYSLTEYKNMRTKVKIIYDGIVYSQTPYNHLKYPVEYTYDQRIFLIKAKRKWGLKYDYSLLDYKGSSQKVKIIYNGNVYEQYPSNHLHYAPERVNNRTTEEFIKDSVNVHGNKYDYRLTEYKTSKSKVKIICKVHGEFNQYPHIHLKGSGCTKCNESNGEKEISKFLNKYGVVYQREHKFVDCKNVYPLRFDFYIPSMRTCIEFDGIQHYQPVQFFGGKKSYDLLKENDYIKNEYCEDNYINLIRIRYDEYDNIYPILWNTLGYHIRRLKLN